MIAKRLLPLLRELPPVPPEAPCRSGCTSCCLGPFDISAAEAGLLATALSLLPLAKARGMRLRASAQLDACRSIAPDWASPWDIELLGEDRFDSLSETLAALPCPALDPENGACLVYDFRPAACRITGMAISTPQGDILENVCPILEQHPDYRDAAPVGFDLLRWEDRMTVVDDMASVTGAVRTTVAGAVSASPNGTGSPEAPRFTMRD